MCSSFFEQLKTITIQRRTLRSYNFYFLNFLICTLAYTSSLKNKIKISYETKEVSEFKCNFKRDMAQLCTNKKMHRNQTHVLIQLQKQPVMYGVRGHSTVDLLDQYALSGKKRGYTWSAARCAPGEWRTARRCGTVHHRLRIAKSIVSVGHSQTT